MSIRQSIGRSTIITCAVTGEGPFNKEHPNFPVTPAQICDAVVEAAKAGAAVAHCHVRDPKTGEGTHDVSLYEELTARIRESGEDIILNLTCGGNADFVPEPFDSLNPGTKSTAASVDIRVKHIESCRPDIASLDVTTMNDGDMVYLNTAPTLRAMAKRFREVKVKPEIEVFGPGDLEFVKDMIERGLLDGNPLIQFVLGVKWGMPATIDTVLYMKSLLPESATWGMLGIGRDQMPAVALSSMLGGNVRVGLEDNLYLKKGVFATNGQLVEQAKRIIEDTGGSVATVSQAREILSIP